MSAETKSAESPASRELILTRLIDALARQI
jgi:hypothetical protein